MNTEIAMIHSWCRAIVDSKRGKLTTKDLQEVEGHLVGQKEYLEMALSAIKEAKERLA